jgi:hypothetical protein
VPGKLQASTVIRMMDRKVYFCLRFMLTTIALERA